ncbi:MAG TPA: DNA-protecting protein DprA [Alphaproteobacteria bacterium]|nr:DNA-protecting protein DprA [Alphaproteobacteria bacterium]
MKALEKLARLQLIRSSKIGPITFGILLARYGSGIDAVKAIPELARRSGVKPELVSMTSIEDEIARVEKYGGRIIVRGEDGYPPILDMLDDAPGAITMRGHSVLLEKPAVAMVGSRNCSVNAVTFSEKIAEDLGQEGLVVVSGLARGIDAAAHRGSLAHGTIAVVAGGIDQTYPRENEKLYHAIADQGLLIAEMPFGMQPLARHFPIRNRLIASLSSGVVVVEAGMRSGSLITAREASDRGREVMAVPGSPLDPRSLGCNSLIRDGATLVVSARDVIENLCQPELSIPPSKPWSAQSANDDTSAPADITKARDKLKEFLGYEATEVDELIRQCHLSPAVTHSALLEMELAGEVMRHFGNRVSRVYES